MRIASFHRERRRSWFRLGLLVVGASAVAACGGGGGGGGTPTSPPMPQVRMVSGSTTTVAAGSCTADSHDFLAAEGSTVQVTLTGSSDAAGLMVQVCAGGIDDNNCTINLQRIAVGATLSGQRHGGNSQNLKFLRRGCTGVDPFVAGAATYTATVTYLAP